MFSYIPSLISPLRRKTREVSVGSVKIGGMNPVVVQSMTTTPTTDTRATVEQIQRLIDVGCPIVRLTVPTQADMDNIPNIKSEMKRRGLTVPLVADIHFLPKLALQAVDWFDKVRINPGNFADRKKFEVREYTDAQYQEELDRIREAFLPVIRRSKLNGVSLRIGTNHGSLSDRIMNRFGDTPQGMVESALEFIRIAEDEGFHDIIISMKASNVRVMIQAYRLLVARMNECGMEYPLHLGVTEAGDGEDGRIKSAMGIGSLLADGLGDTVRVSLTEDPEREIPVARELVKLYERPFECASSPLSLVAPSWDFYSYQRRDTDAFKTKECSIGGKEPVRVVTHLASAPSEGLLTALEPEIEKVSWILGASSQDRMLPHLPGHVVKCARLEGLTVGDFREPDFDELSVDISPVWREDAYVSKIAERLAGKFLWLRIKKATQLDELADTLQSMKQRMHVGVTIESSELVDLGRAVASKLTRAGLKNQIHLAFLQRPGETPEAMLLRASVELGALLSDGIGDSVEIRSDQSLEFNHRLSFNVLQAARLRMTKTEYIACPSCGRTLFDLQETTARIREKTGHLKGVKIAVMGCIVNGPGEMADADFGYVGSGPGQINLYVGKDCVERHIPQEHAVAKLIDLIKQNDRWIDPPRL